MGLADISNSLSNTEFIQRLQDLFSNDELEDLARSTGFIVRSSSRLSGRMFLELNVCDFGENGGMSLTEKCNYLSENYDVEMSKQSLDERYHTFSVKFMRACLERIWGIFTSGFEGIVGLQSKFTAVKVTDSTSFQLPAELASFYVSNGGATSGASVKIHQSYELLKGQIVDFHITDGKANDVNYWLEGGLKVFPQELHLTDLGYYHLGHLGQIAQKGAYFISRYKTGTNLYVKDQAGKLVELDLAALVDGVSGCMELEEVYAGKEYKLPVRLTIQKLPEEIKAKRLKKLKKQAAHQSKQKKGWQNSELRKILCGYNLFITNVSRGTLSAAQISLFYSLRWQIELLFKIWKSLLKIDKIGKMSIFRFECYLYGKLIALLITNQIQAFLRDSFAHDPDIDLELSEWKAVQFLKKNSYPYAKHLGKE